MNLSTLANISYDLVSNLVQSTINKPYSMLYYVVESANWAIKWEGKYITDNLKNDEFLDARITTTDKGIHNQIIHFGSKNMYPVGTHSLNTHKSNKIILTWYHIVPDDPMNKLIILIHKNVHIIHTSCTITQKKLIEMGIPPEKIVVIPIGVDLNRFKPVSPKEKQKIKDELGIPRDKIIIGSFQKDGVGWGEGMEPKLIKGPDVFLDVVEKLNQNYDIFVLLTGPARGYVKNGLDNIGVPYKHLFLDNYLEIPKYYNALDLYIVTSRAEGGPKAIVESMAAGIPIVSTRVGMAPDIIKDGHNGFLAEVNDVVALSDKASQIIENEHRNDPLITNALNTVKKYSWVNITEEYHEKIYSKLISDVCFRRNVE